MKRIDLIIFSGQSNMQGQAECLSENEVVDGAYEYRFLSDRLEPLKNPVGESVRFDRSEGVALRADVPLREVLADWLASHVVGSASYGYTNLVPEFCRAYIGETGREVVAVHAAKGSTEIAYWQPDGEAYCFIVDKTRAAIARVNKEYEIDRIFFVWLQGESDAIAGRSKSYYKEKLTALCAALKNDIGINSFCVIRVGRFTRDARDDEIISAQDEVCRESEKFIMLTEIAAELCDKPEYMNPNVAGHYSARGYELLGRTAGSALRKYVDEV